LVSFVVILARGLSRVSPVGRRLRLVVRILAGASAGRCRYPRISGETGRSGSAALSRCTCVFGAFARVGL